MSKISTIMLVQDARYVIKSVICDPNFERLVLGCIDADLVNTRWTHESSLKRKLKKVTYENEKNSKLVTRSARCK